MTLMAIANVNYDVPSSLQCDSIIQYHVNSSNAQRSTGDAPLVWITTVRLLLLLCTATVWQCANVNWTTGKSCRLCSLQCARPPQPPAGGADWITEQQASANEKRDERSTQNDNYLWISTKHNPFEPAGYTLIQHPAPTKIEQSRRQPTYQVRATEKR